MQGYLLEVKEKLDGLWCTQQALEQQYAIPTAFKAYKDALYTWWRTQE